jgi:hypothetical protein
MDRMSYRAVSFDTVAPLMPFNKTASMVAGRGEHFEWSPQESQTHSRDPIRTRKAEPSEMAQPTWVDLTGATLGRLRVLGIAELKSRAGANWVVRCVCGSYETRKARFIKACLAGDNPGQHPPMCASCGYTQRLQMGRHHPKKAAAAAEAIQNCMK